MEVVAVGQKAPVSPAGRPEKGKMCLCEALLGPCEGKALGRG